MRVLLLLFLAFACCVSVGVVIGFVFGVGLFLRIGVCIVGHRFVVCLVVWFVVVSVLFVMVVLFFPLLSFLFVCSC